MPYFSWELCLEIRPVEKNPWQTRIMDLKETVTWVCIMMSQKLVACELFHLAMTSTIYQMFPVAQALAFWIYMSAVIASITLKGSTVLSFVCRWGK